MSLTHVLASFAPASTTDSLRDDIQRITACRAWFEMAHQGAGDGGIAACYDPVRSKWFPSYPETTGYIIPTLLNIGDLLNNPQSQTLAQTLGEFLLEKRNSEGAISHWRDHGHSPVVFDTGQVLFGWLALSRTTDDSKWLEAALKAGDWLINSQDEEGGWSRFQHLAVKKTIDSRVAWALVILSQYCQDNRYADAARLCLDWVRSRQLSNGWYQQASFHPGEDPFTHTIVYTAEGLLESGLELENEDYIASSQKTADSLLRQQKKDGSLASTYSKDWQPSSPSVCLTGLCQSARLWLQFAELTGHKKYEIAAHLALDYLRKKQKIRTTIPEIRGAMAGSSPFFGKYERFKYPNWATKFLADALLTKEAFTNHQTTSLKYKG